MQICGEDWYKTLNQGLIARFKSLWKLLAEILRDCLDSQEDLPLALFLILRALLQVQRLTL